MATAKLSEWVGKKIYFETVSPDKLQARVDKDINDDTGTLFAKVFPMAAYYSVEVVDGSIEVKNWEGRLDAAKYRDENNKKADRSIKTFRDYYVRDSDLFESFVVGNLDEVKYSKLPRGMRKVNTSITVMRKEADLESMTDEEAIAYALALAKERTINGGKAKRTQSEKTREALKVAREARGKSKSSAPKGRK